MTPIIVGRFQVPELHEGHKHLFNTATKETGQSPVVILGLTGGEVDEYAAGKNPYDVSHRINLFLIEFGYKAIKAFSGIEDQPGKDEEWSKNLDDIAGKYEDPIFYVGRDSFKSHYKGKYKVIEIESLPGYSGTEMRAKLKK